jgi:hypothetical protein
MARNNDRPLVLLDDAPNLLGRLVRHMEDDNGQHWNVHHEWRLVNGRAEPVALAIVPRDPSRLAPITTTLLRELNIGTELHEARQHVTAVLAVVARDHPDSPAEATAETFARPRTKALTDDELERVARIYRNAVEVTGLPPVEAVADAFSLSKSAAAKRVMAARKAGHLPPTTRGQARA